MKSLTLCIALFLCLAAVSSASRCPSDDFKTCLQGGLNVTRYAGTWYTIFQSKSFINNKDCHCEYANYTVGSDGKVGVHNRCRVGGPSGKPTGVDGFAQQVDPTNHPCRLEVEFPTVGAFAKGPYWIVETDYDSYTVVASCPFGSVARLLDLDDVWILSRTPTMDDALQKRLLGLLVSMGFDVKDFQAISQTGCEGHYPTL